MMIFRSTVFEYVGNMYPNVVSIDNGPYFVLLGDLTFKYDRY